MQRLKTMMGSRDYIQALEHERRKIQVFSKELPLSLDLVTQAIEACRQQLSETTTEYNMNGHNSECSEQTTSTDNGPVLEEFIPIKKRPSSPHEEEEEEEEDDDDEQHSHHHRHKISKDNTDKRKSDWLRSVQLWNNPEPSSPPHQEVNNKKGGAVEVKRSGSGGAFQPFHKEKDERVGGGGGKAIASDDLKPPCSSNSSKKEEKEGQRKQRRCWSQELHKRFLQALQQLGGPDSATPKQIRELMKVDGLTNDEVKSHLQKYRLHTRRPSGIVHNNGSPQTTPFVLVGNIFVQPPEYAAAAVATSADLAPAGIYAPVATHPPPPPPRTAAGSTRRPQLKKSSNHMREDHHHSHSEEDRANHSNSPASSSSTHTTTTTSPAY
ncbi:transcription factor HRS1-like [Arachis stenosperma]|uniref:transcription factor HRS1-like n=1 Tax=Arachis stenosperma TaxID=217475 RepID=UPI0025AC051B|nr:transcription factor HRS1-like [Arachis stenosperma]